MSPRRLLTEKDRSPRTCMGPVAAIRVSYDAKICCRIHSREALGPQYSALYARSRCRLPRRAAGSLGTNEFSLTGRAYIVHELNIVPTSQLSAVRANEP